MDRSFGASPSLVVQLCSEPWRMLALLFTLALCLRIKRTIHNLAELAKELPDELLAILQPEHGVQWRYAHLLRSDPKTDTFILFAFDEACIAPLTLVPMPQRSHSLLASPT